MYSLTLTPILRFMGDQPGRNTKTGNELTDQIFGPSLKDVSIDYKLKLQVVTDLLLLFQI